MQEKFQNYIAHRLKEIEADDQAEHYIELFPELDSRLAKFAIGIFLWNKSGEIDIDNPDDVGKVRIILKIIDQTPAFDFFDETFNDADPDTVLQILGIDNSLHKDADEKKRFDYSVVPISDYKEAYRYFEAAPWCIVISEESFNAYTAKGNCFYVCENDDWSNTPCIPGTGFPRDSYGYSLFAVEVTPDNRIASITSRWNTCAGNTEFFISEEELLRILGEKNYQKLFIKRFNNK